MTDIPVRGYCCLAVADETHGVHQAHVLPDGIGEDGIVLLCRIVGEIHAAAVSIAELLILAAGVIIFDFTPALASKSNALCAIAPAERQALTITDNIFFIYIPWSVLSRSSGLCQDLFT
jgi:hypothetical protein